MLYKFSNTVYTIFLLSADKKCSYQNDVSNSQKGDPISKIPQIVNDTKKSEFLYLLWVFWESLSQIF